MRMITAARGKPAIELLRVAMGTSPACGTSFADRRRGPVCLRSILVGERESGEHEVADHIRIVQPVLARLLSLSAADAKGRAQRPTAGTRRFAVRVATRKF